MKQALIILAMIAALIALVIYGLFELPDAMHAETMNQRAIAAGNYKHKPGVHEYEKFVDANNAH